MAKADTEVRVFYEGSLNQVFIDLAKECMKQGIIIERAEFDWCVEDALRIGAEPEEYLRGVKVTSSTTAMRKG